MIAGLLRFLPLLAHKHWPRERLEELRRAKLRRLIDHAYRHVPYYRRLMDSAGVSPAEIRETADLVRLPVTTKQDLRAAGADALATGHGPLQTVHTSGHSGIPFVVHVSAAEDSLRNLRDFRFLLGIGLRARDRVTYLGPAFVPPDRLYRRLGLYRLDAIPLTLGPAEQLRRLRLARPDVLWAYPSILQGLLTQAGCPLSRIAHPRSLVSSSEVMQPKLFHELRADRPDLDIVNTYASIEVGRIAAECRVRRGLHLEDDAQIVELLDPHGVPVEPGRQGSVVVTCLDQFAMPFIRYEQGDLCRLLPGSCACGWSTPRMDLPLGRTHDMLALPDGTCISPHGIVTELRAEQDLLQYRFVQERRDRVRAQLCFRLPPSPERLAGLRERMERIVEGRVRVDIELVPEIQFEGRKFRPFISRISA